MHKYCLYILIIASMLLISCEAASTRLPGGLVLEEHLLLQAPSSDLFSFQPAEGTQEQILAQHADERNKVTPVEYLLMDNNPALSASQGGSEFIATVLTDGSMQQTVQLSKNGGVIFNAPAGLPSPVVPLQGLWVYNDHWAMEILFSSPEVWVGQIFMDGQLVNEEKGYEEAFGFQLLAGKPFFFYQRENKIGISYDGQEADLGYTGIPHYRCCSESVLNPIPAENMIAFFAQRGETWYYVELGNFR